MCGDDLKFINSFLEQRNFCSTYKKSKGGIKFIKTCKTRVTSDLVQ